jgi:hypothetical protein
MKNKQANKIMKNKEANKIIKNNVEKVCFEIHRIFEENKITNSEILLTLETLKQGIMFGYFEEILSIRREKLEKSMKGGKQ